MGNLGALDEARVRQVWAGVEARTLEGSLVTLAVIEIAPNTTVPEHQHPNEQIGVLAQGRLRFTIGDETHDLLPGGTWTIPGDVPTAPRRDPRARWRSRPSHRGARTGIRGLWPIRRRRCWPREAEA